jgi:hypothetical protein
VFSLRVMFVDITNSKFLIGLSLTGCLVTDLSSGILIFFNNLNGVYLLAHVHISYRYKRKIYYGFCLVSLVCCYSMYIIERYGIGILSFL